MSNFYCVEVQKNGVEEMTKSEFRNNYHFLTSENNSIVNIDNANDYNRHCDIERVVLTQDEVFEIWEDYEICDEGDDWVKDMVYEFANKKLS